jgi:phosphopantothenoylcysteine decarboxylase/phosphopantothenate--cysteine ligase
MQANTDILASTTAKLRAKGNPAIVIGFAAESRGNLEELALAKLSSKGCDYIVANDISSGAVFNSEENNVLLVSAGAASSFAGSKYEVARGVLEAVSSKVGMAQRGDSK